MKQSRYNVKIDLDGDLYLFNLWKGTLVSLEPDELNNILNNNFTEIPEKEINTLLNLGFLTNVEDEFEEVKKENQYIVDNPKQFSICISSTFKCNAKCSYCFEKGIASKEMDKETIDSIVDYIEKNAKLDHTHITWFGGEPLVGFNNILEISQKLNDRNVKFYSSMISNGYLLDKYLDTMIEECHLKRVQITLDGLYEEYDAVKQLGINGFSKVISNIHLAIEKKLKVSIRINYNSENLCDYKKLIKFVYDEFGNKVSLYFHDIVGEEFKTPNEVKPNPLLKIYDEMLNYGYIKNIKDFRLKRTYMSCALNIPSFINVCPDGETTKCEHYVGRQSQFSVGNINVNKDFSKQFNVVHDSCAYCRCFPICGGGCLSNHLVKKNGGCTRIKSIVEEVIKLYIRRCRDESNAC